MLDSGKSMKNTKLERNSNDRHIRSCSIDLQDCKYSALTDIVSYRFTRGDGIVCHFCCVHTHPY